MKGLGPATKGAQEQQFHGKPAVSHSTGGIGEIVRALSTTLSKTVATPRRRGERRANGEEPSEREVVRSSFVPADQNPLERSAAARRKASGPGPSVTEEAGSDTTTKRQRLKGRGARKNAARAPGARE